MKKEFTQIAAIMQSVLSLLRPFQWHFTTITYVASIDMADYLDAPVPFLIGVSSKLWLQIATVKDICSEVLVFDLDS